MDRFFQIVIYGFLALVVGCSGCAMSEDKSDIAVLVEELAESCTAGLGEIDVDRRDGEDILDRLKCK
jgi:hypothetical protein